MEPEPEESAPEGYQCILDFDRLYSKGLLLLSDFPDERRFMQLRLPVLWLSVGWWALHCVASYALGRRLKKRLGRLLAYAGVAILSCGSAVLWLSVPRVREYFRLEWKLTQKYRPMIYAV